MDDEPDAAATLARLFARLGADVETAHDGGRAVAAVAEFQPHIVLLDIGMPSMDGYEAARRIRETPAGRAATLVALTGWTRDDDQRRARDAGFDLHLAKPVAPEALARLLAGPAAEPADAHGSEIARGLFDEMSHDVRTPLGTLAAAARLLAASPLDDDQRELVHVVRRCGEALAAAVDDLIDLASIESGTFRLDASPFDPGALIDDCVTLLGAEAAARRVEVYRYAETRLPAAVVGDAGRVRRVALCHLREAVRSAAHGGVMVTVASRPAADGRVEIEVCARDARRDGTPPAPGDGAEPPPAADGAGGRAAQFLCERMAGRTWSTREPGGAAARGFTFSAPEAPLPGAGGSAAATGAARRVLVADDDPVVRRMAVLLLEEIGLAADAVASGGEAVAAVTRGRYDAVLLDARMPDGSGADALREIRRVAPPPLGPRLVAMTASASRSDHEELRAAGAEACLLKPLTAGVLREALGAVAAPATLDARVVQRLAAGRTQSGPAAFAQLVDLYLDDTPAQLTRLREAATLGDAGGLGLIAHRLRGSSASIGATHMMTLASEVESRAGRGDMAAACSATQALEGAWIATRVALEQARRAPR